MTVTAKDKGDAPFLLIPQIVMPDHSLDDFDFIKHSPDCMDCHTPFLAGQTAFIVRRDNNPAPVHEDCEQ